MFLLIFNTINRLEADFSINGLEGQSPGDHLASYANNLEDSSDSDICEARGNCGIEDDDLGDGDDDEEEEEDDDDDTAYVQIMPPDSRDLS